MAASWSLGGAGPGGSLSERQNAEARRNLGAEGSKKKTVKTCVYNLYL
jgi:hypothetical protein